MQKHGGSVRYYTERFPFRMYMYVHFHLHVFSVENKYEGIYTCTCICMYTVFPRIEAQAPISFVRFLNWPLFGGDL